MSEKPKISVLASGNGSTFEALKRAEIEGKLEAEISLLVSSNPRAYCLERAENLKVRSGTFNQKDFDSFEAWDGELSKFLTENKTDYVVLAGFLKKIGPSLLAEFPGKIINTHPSLLPKYGGKGMFGARVHEAVFSDQSKETGVTIHKVNENYDEGQIIAQKKIAIDDCESAKEIEDRVKSVEPNFLIETLNKFLLEAAR